MDVILLGTGTPNAEPDRSGPAVAVVPPGGRPFLVDAGPGVVRRAAAAGLDPKRLNRVFLTHLHSDHAAGLPDLLLTPWTLGRLEPLELWGPPGVAALAAHVAAAYDADITNRLGGLEPANDTGYKVLAREVAPGVVYEDEGVGVDAFLVDHGGWDAYGYRFRARERVVVISGDTRPCAALVAVARGADVLVHECYAARRFAEQSPAWRRYHEAMHTSTRELAALAAEARPKLLVLYHHLAWGARDDELVAEVKEGYGGEVVAARDLDVF
jgi:ribonuclease BN (tRNA processing enzyme)